MAKHGNLATHCAAICVLAALSVCGCAARGEARETARPDVRPAIDAIALCRTTEVELRRSLGAPTRNGRLRDARILSWIVGDEDDGVVHYVAVMLDATGRVVDLYWDVPSEVPWTPADQCRRR